MTAGERFAEVEHLYHLALEKDPGQRTDFLKGACGGSDGSGAAVIGRAAAGALRHPGPSWSGRNGGIDPGHGGIHGTQFGQRFRRTLNALGRPL